MKKTILIGITLLVIINANAQFNKRNPYDSVGIKHNLALKEFLSSKNIERLKEGIAKKAITKNNFLKHFQGTCCEKNNWCCGCIPTEPWFPRIGVKEKLSDLVMNTKGKALKSAFLISYLNNLEKVFNSLPKKNISDKNIRSLIILETSVMNDNRLTQIQKDVFLVVASIARHTAFLWSEIRTSHPKWCYPIWEVVNLEKENPGKEDVRGGLEGAIGGALAGSLAGGVGAGPGALVGGLGGAIASSATAAIMNFFD